MEQILTASADKEMHVETLTTMQPVESVWQNKNFVRVPNSDHPDVAFTVGGPEGDKNESCDTEGWRYIKTMADGQVKHERVPLTPYELLHPKDGYEIGHHTEHSKNTLYLKTVLGHHLNKKPNAYLYRYLQIDFNLPGIEPVSPDISAIFNIAEEKAWSTFNCQKEGVCPSVIFEVTSPGTRKGDFGEKYEYYQWAGVPYYIIVDIICDAEEQPFAYELFVYERSENRYVRMEPNAQGRYWLPPLEISIDIGDKRLRCYDALGKYLMSHTELARALKESKKKCDAFVKRADEFKQIAEREAARAAELKRITNEFIQIRLAAEAKIAELRASKAELQRKS